MSQNVQAHRAPHPPTGGHISELANGLNQSAPSSTAQAPRTDDARYSPQTQPNFTTPPVSSSRSLPVQGYSSTLTSYESAAAAASNPNQAVTHPQQQQLHHSYTHGPVQLPVYANPPVFFQHQHPPPGPAPPQQPPPTSNSASPSQSSISPNKRKFDESQADEFSTSKGGNKTVRKRRMRVSLSNTGGPDEIKEDVIASPAGPKEGRGEGGGAKHWTDDEKGKLFVWMLDSDDNWAAFANQMNSVFREASQALFNGTKSFTALKSCYHRNVETFKQIFAFTQFLISSLNPNADPSISAASADPNAAGQDILAAPIPPSFQSSIHRQTFLERKLEAGRSVAGIPVANLNIKVVDHWYRLGWYELFRRRYRFDPIQNTVIPYHGPDACPPDPLTHIFPHPPPNFPSPIHALNANSGVHSDNMAGPSGVVDHMDDYARTPDESDRDDHQDGHQDTEDMHENDHAQHNQQQRTVPSSSHSQLQPKAPGPPPPTNQLPQQTNGVPPPQPAPPPALGYAYPTAAYGPHPSDPNGHAYYAAYKPPYVPQPMPQPPQAPTQPQQSLQHLESLTQTLITSCNTLTELLRAQVDDGKALRELLRRMEEREARREESAHAVMGVEGMGGKEKAAFAKEMLSTPDVSEEVKQAAATYLKRLFQ